MDEDVGEEVEEEEAVSVRVVELVVAWKYSAAMFQPMERVASGVT